YLDNAQLVSEAGLGASWQEFKASLRQIRQQGYAVPVGEVGAGVFWLPPPGFGGNGKFVGSISIVRPTSQMDSVQWTKETAALVDIGKRLSADTAVRFFDCSSLTSHLF